MLTCIAVDDEFGAIEVLTRYIDKTPFLELRKSFRDPLAAVSFLSEEKVDLIFLDISMPNLNGMEFLSALNYQPMVIFSTAYKEFALESYEKNAVDYLLKPFEFDRFLKATSKALEQKKKIKEPVPIIDFSEREDAMVIKSGSKIYVLKYDDLIYLEKEEHYIRFLTDKERVLSRMSLNQLQELLPKQKFLRVHRSFIVALNKIETIQSDHLKIKGHRVPIGPSYRETLLRMFKPLGS